jgi:hypothetical protein
MNEFDLFLLLEILDIDSALELHSGHALISVAAA